MADVRVVSDEIADRQNPVEEPSRALSNYAEERSNEGIPAGFDFRAGGNCSDPWNLNAIKEEAAGNCTPPLTIREPLL